MIKKDGAIVCPINDKAEFTSEVPPYQGLYVKSADEKIIGDLREAGKLLKKEDIVHNYPYCWRSHTPLIYRAMPSWFIRVEENRELLIEKAMASNWVPDPIKSGRFYEWLKNSRDWAVSRSRFWGTPIPIWTDDEYSEFIVVGSIKELEELTGKTGINDIHRHFIDQLEIVSPKTGKKLKRIPEVFDCWFESGSMPYSQSHIPFSGEAFEQADFIAEGLDQTRGWFYTLLVISVLLGNPCPFKNNIVNGLILAKDGKKMSKSLKNFPDPVGVIQEHGADAVRFYLINSPAVRAEPMKFNEDGVKLVVKDLMFPWLNSLQFLIHHIILHGNNFKRNPELAYSSTNVLDIWILSKLNSTLKYVHKEMTEYHLHSVLPELANFVGELSKWYIHLARTRMKTGEDALTAVTVLFEVMYNYSIIMAPFAPFFAEFSYQKLKPGLGGEIVDSVHYIMLPLADESKINPIVERKIGLMKSTFLVARGIRDKTALPVKRPLQSFLIVCSEKVKNQIEELTPYIVEDQNILNISFDTNEKKYVRFNATPDYKALGKRLRGTLKSVMAALPNVPYEEMSQLYETSIQNKLQGLPPPQYEICGASINTDEMNIARLILPQDNQNLVGAVDGEIVGYADISLTDQIKDFFSARIVRSAIQTTKKEHSLVPSDKISKVVIGFPPSILRVLQSQDPAIQSIIGAPIEIQSQTIEPNPDEKFVEKKGLLPLFAIKLVLE